MPKHACKFIVLSGLALLTLSVPLSAEVLDEASINVPFIFQAGSVNLPAGPYKFIRESSMGLIRIEGPGGNAMLMTHPGAWLNDASNSSLEFSIDGPSHILKQVRFGGTSASVLTSARGH